MVRSSSDLVGLADHWIGFGWTGFDWSGSCRFVALDWIGLSGSSALDIWRSEPMNFEDIRKAWHSASLQNGSAGRFFSRELNRKTRRVYLVDLFYVPDPFRATTSLHRMPLNTPAGRVAYLSGCRYGGL
jgi:hypothetical protein